MSHAERKFNIGSKMKKILNIYCKLSIILIPRAIKIELSLDYKIYRIGLFSIFYTVVAVGTRLLIYNAKKLTVI